MSAAESPATLRAMRISETELQELVRAQAPQTIKGYLSQLKQVRENSALHHMHPPASSDSNCPAEDSPVQGKAFMSLRQF